MGLDIYLSGRITSAPFHTPSYSDGCEIEEIRVKLGHWRKDWHLQNYMMDRFPDETMVHNELSLNPADLREILGEIQSGALADMDDQPYTMPAFEHTVSILQSAIEWLEKAPDSEWRDVIYRASW